jgi:SAM-dependent methyltransferase
MGTRVSEAAVIWHDLECGCYTADLPMWRELAAAHRATAILDIGAGTGRVALDLAEQGHQVIALERDDVLARELSRRAAGLPIDVLCADACDFSLATPVALCIVPMQTIHLLDDRAAFLRCARAALVPGGLLALSLLGDDVQPFSIDLDAETAEHDGVHYASTPTALRQTKDTVVLERRRCATDGSQRSVSLEVTALAQLDAAVLTAEARPAGLSEFGSLQVSATAEHVGTDVLLLQAVDT